MNLNPILPFLFLIFATLFPSSLEAPLEFRHFPSKHLQGLPIHEGEFNYNVVPSGELVENSSLILAAKRTNRRDPLDKFQYYKAGWNISNEHYFYSVGFTAAPLLFIATLWFLGFGVCLFVICLQHCCFHHQRHGFFHPASMVALTCLILFTVATITGCIVLFIGQGNFQRSSLSTLRYVVHKADITAEKLKDVSKYLSSAKQIQVGQFSLPPDMQDKIDSVDSKINASASTLGRETEKNSDMTKHILDYVGMALIIVATVMLILGLLGVVSSVFGMQCLTHTLVVVGWILITVTFILCGLYAILHNVTGDTCLAMEEWVQNPTAHTALDDIIPCVDKATADEALNESKDVVIRLVSIVNTFITNVSNRDFPPGAGSLYFNQSGPLVPILCNPFNSNKTDRRRCTSDEVEFSIAGEEWRRYICNVSTSGICTTIGRLTPAFYDQIMSAVDVSYALYYYSRFLVDLGDCTFVRDIFTVIGKDYCPSLIRYSKSLYVGLALVSIALMLSVIFWLFNKRERHKYVSSSQGEKSTL